ncbi:MAG: universal stress protein, partial [Polaromonas sp.]|nr:universal stress protein [Polaromonas sp.]
MKILFAADGSKYTKKAIAFLVTHESLAGPEDELVVLNVQSPVPGRVTTMLGSTNVKAYHEEEAKKVLDPIERLLKRHKLKFRTTWIVGSPAPEVVRAAKREKAHMIVMGTHGQGLLSRA